MSVDQENEIVGLLDDRTMWPTFRGWLSHLGVETVPNAKLNLVRNTPDVVAFLHELKGGLPLVSTSIIRRGCDQAFRGNLDEIRGERDGKRARAMERESARESNAHMISTKIMHLNNAELDPVRPDWHTVSVERESLGEEERGGEHEK